MNDLLETFKDKIKKQHLFSLKDKLIIAVSGGVDSVVLCELCKQAKFDFSIAHCNFQLRGAESERDEEFVKQLADKYQVQVFLKKFDTETYALQKRISIQEAARNLRYEWFDELLDFKVSSFDFHVLLTAHHADDNIETLLMHFFRGTGLAGLTGIPEKSAAIGRPLLSFTKKELISFAEENTLKYVEDSSNASSKYTRNFFRNELLPQIEKVYPQVKENLRSNIDRLTDIEQLYQMGVESLKKKLCRQKGREIYIPVKQLIGFNNRALIYEIIKDYGFSEKQIDEVVKLGTSESGRYLISPGLKFQIIRHRHWFIITPFESIESTNIIIEKHDGQVAFNSGTLSISKIEALTTNYKLQTTNSAAFLDAKHIQFSLLLRKSKTGDYFYPLGMKKKKKISRFLIDQKLSKIENENVWVIESGNRIIWVVGNRIDERFKITETTKEVIRLELR